MYQLEKKKLQNGFNTWNTYSTACFVHLPSGCALSIGFKEYLWGSVLTHTLIGQPGANAPEVFAGPHCYDGSYSLQDLSWKRLKIRIESAWEDQDLYLRISLLENTTRFVPLCYLQGAVLGTHPAIASAAITLFPLATEWGYSFYKARSRRIRPFPARAVICPCVWKIPYY